MKIGRKLALAVSALLAVTIAALGIIIYSIVRGKLERSIIARMEEEMKDKAGRLQPLLESAGADVLFMTEVSSVSSMLDLRQSGVAEMDTYATAVRRMQLLFGSMLMHKSNYWQIRYIDEKGFERVRTDLVAGKVHVTPEADLQDKSSQSYFLETMKLPPKSVYYSPLNLNREHGVVEIPHRSTVRVATPLDAAGGTRFGLLVINLDGKSLLAHLHAELGTIYLVNQDGFFLKHPDPDKEFAFDLGKNDRLSDLDPRLASQLPLTNSFVEHWRHGPGGQPVLHGLRKVFYQPNDPKNFWVLIFEVPEKEAFRTLQTLRAMIAGAGALIALCGGFVALVFANHFTRPLETLAHAAERVAAGDLTVEVAAKNRDDEIGLLEKTFRHMNENLRSIMQEILAAANVLNSSGNEIRSATANLGISATETATAVHQTAATVEEAKQAARLSSQKSQHVAENAQQAADVAHAGREAVEKTIENMGSIRQEITGVTNSILRLSEQSHTIGEIIATVDDLAAQSNLLAVNASIEAANAGEQGKGFAVVAQEVRSLSSQSKQATKRIRKILSEIQQATKQVVLATGRSSEAVEAGVSQSSTAGDSIRSLSDHSTEAAQAAAQIAASSQEQFVGMDQVAAAMSHIRQASVQTVTSTQQAEQVAQQLQELGQKLKKLIEKFKV